ncbi:ABC transporter permease [Actinocorallia sp. API 0066]|uniref:ABC transporter permease n=1 Tax=Actinocorallia sp. API 0066 TaxID=2896846 RepID=UPI001E60CCF3|nr:ABC transporter permease [Actinocorallia sp. API 0066]MCD0452929.1 ABC transporter permease [Actinocorallia sp. API 0066]
MASTTLPAVKTAPEATSAKRPRAAWARRAFVPSLSIVLGLAAWYFVSYALLTPDRRFLLPPAHEVLTRALLDPEHVRPMLEALAVTARITALGLTVATLIGVLAGILMSRSRVVEQVVFPYAVMLQVVPVLALVPLIGIWFGYGSFSRTVVCVIIALFPIITNTHFGMRSIDRSLHELFTLGRASGPRRLLSLELPAALPSILTGLRIASGQAVVGAIIGDMFFAQGEPGIGTLLAAYQATLRSHDLVAAIFLASLFGVAVFSLFALTSRLAVGRWHSSGAR